MVNQNKPQAMQRRWEVGLGKFTFASIATLFSFMLYKGSSGKQTEG